MSTTEPKMVKVKLLAPHEHRGEMREKGEVLEMPDFRAERLINPSMTDRSGKTIRPVAALVK